MPNAQHHIDLIAKLHLESLFSAHLSPAARRTPDKSSSSLTGLSASTVAACRSGPTEAGPARAAAKIAHWMSYLPADCVKLMVDDGWHYST